MAKRTIAEWIRDYPEDWEPASNAENYDPDSYQLLWSEDYTMFNASKLAWGSGNEAYIAYQCAD